MVELRAGGDDIQYAAATRRLPTGLRRAVGSTLLLLLALARRGGALTHVLGGMP